jgi:tyrosinase
MPTALPAQALKKGGIVRVQSQMGRQRGRPSVGDFAATRPRTIAAGRRSIGGARDVSLTENSVSVQVPVQGQDSESLQTIAVRSRGRRGGSAGKNAAPANGYQSINIVLDDIKLLAAGKAGGFFYKVYLNLPEGGDPGSSEIRYFLGTVGPFEIESASHQVHHGGAAQLVFPATDALADMPTDNYKNLTVSLVRVSGSNSPKGRAISVGEVRVEVSTDEPYDLTPHVPAPSNSPYHR